jgi:hypothetical protein
MIDELKILGWDKVKVEDMGITTLERRKKYVFTTFKQLQTDVYNGYIDAGFAAFILDDFGHFPDRNRILLAWKARVKHEDGNTRIFVGNRLRGKDLTDWHICPDGAGNITTDTKKWGDLIINEYKNAFHTINFSELVDSIEMIQKSEIDIKDSKPTYWWVEGEYPADSGHATFVQGEDNAPPAFDKDDTF